jgi:PKD repeat protein
MGCWNSIWQNVIVSSAPGCFPLFNSQQLQSTNLTLAFTDLSIADSVSSWYWQFGDGNVSNEQNPVHIYDSAGVYEVSLEIDGISCNNIFSRDIQVLQSNNCIADFDFSQPNPEMTMVNFMNLSTGDFLGYFWDFGDGVTSVEMSPSHEFPSFGIYDVKLIIAGFGCSDSITKQVEITEPIPCEAAFSWWSEGPESTEIFFTNESVGQNDQYIWDFGDGTFSGEENPVHNYNGPGEYLVKLKIMAGLCQDSTNQIIQIAEPAFCEAIFSIVQDYPQSRVISFVNESIGNNFSSIWDFGDGNSSTETDPVHEYSTAGIYQVSLSIYAEDDCSDTAWFTLEILPPLSISGSVWVGENPLSFGDVLLVFDDNEGNINLFDQYSLTNGTFEFSGLVPGNYFLAAIPDFQFPYPVIPKYFPCYSGNQLNWPDAQTFNTNNLPENISINLLSFNDFFDGKASAAGNIVVSSDDSGMPLIMLLYNETGDVRDFRIVDQQYSFSFNKIPYGKYELYPEKAGKNGQSYLIYLSEETPEIDDIVFLETDNSIVPDLTTINDQEALKVIISPNPANEYILINFYEIRPINSETHIKLYNSGQRLISTFSFNNDLFKIDVSGFSQGIYFIELTNNIIQIRKKIIILH